MKAKKSLGQHFLKSEKALSQIIEASNPTIDDVVLEIGPGHGILTERLLSSGAIVIAIEKDHELIPLLEEYFAEPLKSRQFTLIHADILKFDSATYAPLATAYKLVANIPYYITGAIIEQFLSTPHQPTLMVLLMQKEVAERIIARDKKESILSIAVKAYGTPKIVGKVPPGAFVPPPTVDSAVLLIEGVTRDFFIDPNTKAILCDEALFFKVLKGVFGKKRKQIGGSLADVLENKTVALDALAASSIDTKTRPEDLTLEEWKTLTQQIGKVQSSVV